MDDKTNGPLAMDTLLADLMDQSPKAEPEKAPEATEGEAAETTEKETGETVSEEPEKGETDDAESDTDDEADDEPKPKRSKSGSARWKARAEALQAELAEVRSRLPAGDGADMAKAVKAEIGPPPKESDFSDYLAYERALTAYEVEKKLVAREIKSRAAAEAMRAQAQIGALIEEFQEREADTAKALPDYSDVVAKARGVAVDESLAKLILESEKGPLLKYHFAKNPEKLRSLNALAATNTREGIAAVAREIGRLEARLSLPNPKAATKAPAPVAAVKGGATPASPEKELDAWLSKTYGNR